MALSAKKPALLAADTNVLLDRAADDETVMDALDTIRRRLPLCEFIITPTVIEELVLKAEQGDTALEIRLARRALKHLLQPWGFRPMNFIPVGRGIVAEIARKLRHRNLLPDNEVNDSLIIAEAALAGATLLLTSDHHITNIEYPLLKFELESADVSTPLIASPRQIVTRFF